MQPGQEDRRGRRGGGRDGNSSSGGGGRNKSATPGKDMNAYSPFPCRRGNRKILLSPNHRFFVLSDLYEGGGLP
jgi:hypothetical protein